MYFNHKTTILTCHGKDYCRSEKAKTCGNVEDPLDLVIFKIQLVSWYSDLSFSIMKVEFLRYKLEFQEQNSKSVTDQKSEIQVEIPS